MRTQRFHWISTFAVLALVFMMGLFPFVALAQGGEGETCSQFVRRALSELATNCANQEGDTVCYGFNDVTGTLIEGETEPSDFFAEPGYSFALDTIASVTSSAFDFDAKVWGISVMKVLVYPVMDDEADTENMTEEEIEPVEVVIFMIGDVALENNIMATYDDDGNLVVDAETPAPYQEAFLRNGYDSPVCTDTVPPQDVIPPVLLIQGPNDATVDITVNGLTVRLNATEDDGGVLTPFGTTIIMNVLPTEEDMEIAALFGLAELAPESLDAQLVPPGFSSIVCLGPQEDIGLDQQENDQLVSCPATVPEPLGVDLLEVLQAIEDLPNNLLNAPIEVPSGAVGSGIGGPQTTIIFDSPDALQLAQAACDANVLPQDVCDYLF